jgi:hypothetical protein
LRANTRRRSSAHVERDESERVAASGAGGELGAEAACEWAARTCVRLGTTRSRQAEAGASTPW